MPRTSLPNTASAHAVMARAPARLDLAGGWTDVPPYDAEAGGCVCNIAIARYATVRIGATSEALHVAGRREHMPTLALAALRRACITGVHVDVWSDFPMSAGLGGSSAASVALAAAVSALHGDETALDDARRATLAEWSRAVEVEDAGIAGGRQDHYAAAFGGALRLDFGADADGAPARVTRLDVSDATYRAFARRCVVVYTGESRISGETITAVLDAYARRERGVVNALGRMKVIAREIADALVRGALDDVGQMVGEQWTHQRTLHRSIPTPRIDAVIARAHAAGALGAKALGASGGGCVMAIAAEGREDDVRAAVAPLGELVPFDIDRDGVTCASIAATR